MNAAGSASGMSKLAKLNSQAAITPMPIRLNIFRCLVLNDCAARVRKGRPNQNTTGVESAACNQPVV